MMCIFYGTNFEANFYEFGNEFCERLIPSKKQLEKVLYCTEKRDLAFTMVTPYVTNKGLKKLEAVISFVAAKKPQSELVFNDWGVLHFYNKRDFRSHLFWEDF